MNNLLQTTSIRGLTTSLTIGSVVLESLNLSDFLELKFSNAAVTPLTQYPIQYFVREDRKDKQRSIKVFNGHGEQVYTFERLSSYNPVWRMLTFPQRQEIATLRIGLTDRSINFHNKANMTHRVVFWDWGLNGRYRSFYLNDGCKYSWSSSSKFLEKVINPNGGDEENRIRVGKVKLMRQFKFDYEVLVDQGNIDPEIVLATAFIGMFTQWGTGSFTDTIGPTFIPKRVNSKKLETIYEEEN
ncbi:hypothetical protein SBY92_004401 [Candida maltosa Xu316]|uniref:Phospholipid scramblase n=1 Tax=Candida maltosa (strain Xu316) TaxID=1245528 RepID=M3K371_CANMX|nr:hypothetical protein G210_5444 [Candida maltosa Xu316]